MKDLESPEQRAMEREMLRAAGERKRLGENDYIHIAISILLFAVAIVCYSLGYAGIAALVAVGLVTELAAWAFLLGGTRSRELGGKSDEPS
jgi:NhaP-type Na+/H+ or K+/H+ antiporter